MLQASADASRQTSHFLHLGMASGCQPVHAPEILSRPRLICDAVEVLTCTKGI